MHQAPFHYRGRRSAPHVLPDLHAAQHSARLVRLSQDIQALDQPSVARQATVFVISQTYLYAGPVAELGPILLGIRVTAFRVRLEWSALTGSICNLVRRVGIQLVKWRAAHVRQALNAIKKTLRQSYVLQDHTPPDQPRQRALCAQQARNVLQ